MKFLYFPFIAIPVDIHKEEFFLWCPDFFFFLRIEKANFEYENSF